MTFFGLKLLPLSLILFGLTDLDFEDLDLSLFLGDND
jgi:hypothetical protein